MYDDILLPVDGSAVSDAAADHARGLAAATGATVHVLHVVEVPRTTAGAGPEPVVPTVLEDLEASGREVVEAAAERVRSAGVAVETAVREGIADEVIRAYAAERDVDVVVMGTRGRTGLERYLIGSTTERVVRTADRPVLTVREDEGGREREAGASET